MEETNGYVSELKSEVSSSIQITEEDQLPTSSLPKNLTGYYYYKAAFEKKKTQNANVGL